MLSMAQLERLLYQTIREPPIDGASGEPIVDVCLLADAADAGRRRLAAAAYASLGAFATGFGGREHSP